MGEWDDELSDSESSDDDEPNSPWTRVTNGGRAYFYRSSRSVEEFLHREFLQHELLDRVLFTLEEFELKFAKLEFALEEPAEGVQCEVALDDEALFEPGYAAALETKESG